MSETVETTDPVEPIEPVEGAPVEPVDPAEPVEPIEDPTAGLQKALAAERKLHKEAAKRAAALEQQLADKDKPADELAIEQARREAREEAQGAFNARLVQAELKAALSGKVNNTALALKVIDTTEIVVDDSGVDPQSVTDAISALLAEYPELSGASSTKRRIPEVPADPANKPSTPATHADRIAAAQKAGDFVTVIALQNELLAQ